MQSQIISQKEELLTEQQSQTYVRNLLRAAISCVLYLRGIFDESHFVDKTICEINIKALIPKDGDAYTITKWVEMGVFDALRLKYLRTIVFGIYSNPDDQNSLIESYNFNITYHDAKSMDISIDHNSASNNSVNSTTSIFPTKSVIRTATTSLIRRLLSLTQTLPPLPPERHMMMKLLYHPDVTPLDYSPPFFSTRVVDVTDDNSNLENIQIGDVRTPYHTLKFSLLSAPDIDQGLNMHHLINNTQESYFTTSQATDENTSNFDSIGSGISYDPHAILQESDHRQSQVMENNVIGGILGNDSNHARLSQAQGNYSRNQKIFSGNYQNDSASQNSKYGDLGLSGNYKGQNSTQNSNRISVKHSQRGRPRNKEKVTIEKFLGNEKSNHSENLRGDSSNSFDRSLYSSQRQTIPQKKSRVVSSNKSSQVTSQIEESMVLTPDELEYSQTLSPIKRSQTLSPVKRFQSLSREEHYTLPSLSQKPNSQQILSERLRELLFREDYVTPKSIFMELNKHGPVTGEQVGEIIRELLRVKKIGTLVKGKGHPVYSN